MRLVFLFFLTLLFHVSSAQEVDKGSWYFNAVLANATGSYKTYLNAFDRPTSKVGLSLGYLMNVQRKAKVSSPIQIGGEFGFVPWGTDPVISYVGGSFTNGHRTFWINAIARYRPILNASKINPFFDLFIGPEFVSSSTTEIFDTQETQRVFGITKTARNYGMGAGLGIKKENRNGELRYIDIGLYYQNVSKVRSIRRNSVVIAADGYADHQESLIKPNTIQLKIGLTGFL